MIFDLTFDGGWSSDPYRLATNPMSPVLHCAILCPYSMCPHHGTHHECRVCVNDAIVFDHERCDSTLWHDVSQLRHGIAVDRLHSILIRSLTIHGPAEWIMGKFNFNYWTHYYQLKCHATVDWRAHYTVVDDNCSSFRFIDKETQRNKKYYDESPSTYIPLQKLLLIAESRLPQAIQLPVHHLNHWQREKETKKMN